MDFVGAAAKAGLISKNCRKEFIELLTRNPPPSPLLTISHPHEERLQGDVYQGVPFPIIKSDGNVAAKGQICMVLSNTCDLQPQRRETCNIALAAKYLDYKDHFAREHGMARAKSHLEAVEANQIDGFIYLAECPNIEGGLIVLLSKIATIPISLYEKAVADGLRQGSLSSLGFYQFLTKITRLLARVESDDVSPRETTAA